MGLKKQFLLIPVVIFLSGCFLAQKKLVQNTGKSKIPLPEILQEKSLIILPFENLSGKAEFDFVVEAVPPLLYSFLRFSDAFPFSSKMALLKNKTAFWGALGIKKPKPEIRKFYIQEALLKNNRDRLLLYPLSVEKAEKLKDRKLPEHFKLRVLPPRTALGKYLKNNALILRGKIEEDNTLYIQIYEPLTDKIVFKWKTILPVFGYNILDNEKNMQSLVGKFMKPLLEKISGKEFFTLKLKVAPKDATFYINHHFVDLGNSKEVMLPKGKHSIKAVKPDFLTYEGNFDLSKDSVLSLKLKKHEKKCSVNVATQPTGSPVFVNSRFVGYSPVKLQLGQGLHQVRVSRMGYHHSNYILQVFPGQKEKKLELMLKKENPEQNKTKNIINKIKNAAFYTFFPVVGAYLYFNERYEYYQEKSDYYLEQTNNSELSTSDQWDAYQKLLSVEKRRKFFETSNQFFRGSAVFLLITAGILQIVELQMDDVGVGIDQDKNLGVYFRY